MKTSTFLIEKMDCPTEERMIRNRFQGMGEIESLDFNLMSRTLSVTHSFADDRRIVEMIGEIGMEAVPRDPEMRLELPVVQPSFWRRPATILTAISGVFAIAAEILALALGEDLWPVRILAIVAIVVGGWQTAGKAWHSLRNFTLNINFLMAIAVIGAVILGELTEAAMVIFLFALAELIEARSLDRARHAIRGLMELTPERALAQRGTGWSSVPVEDVKRGETVRIKPGERLPLDGIVRHGVSAVDQSPVTGESMPVDKAPGDRVFAGSINQTGTFDFEVTHVAAESTISQIAALVEKASANRARVERFVDRFARYYTPAVLVFAVLVATLPPLIVGAAWSEWIYHGLVLLVIGCPCALVLSTPVTVVSGLAAAARRGILIKGGAYLEAGADLKGIAIDKTGTLTVGRPHVTDVTSLNGIGPIDLLHLAAAVEATSEHPIAGAIIAEHNLHHGEHEEIHVTDFRSITGMGAAASVDGRVIFVGNHRLAHDLGVCSPELEARLERIESEGKTTVVVTDGTEVLGVIAVADKVRESSVRAIEELHALGLRTALLTGDNGTTASTIARSVGIEDVRADLLPADKIEAVRELQERYGSVGMVGDGINDVPALAQANVGFAMGAAGTDIALETADVALMEDNLLKLPEFIRLSRRVIRVLRQNIAIALGLKAIFFVLALTGQATLWMAVFADMGASLIVVFNGLRLLRGKF